MAGAVTYLIAFVLAAHGLVLPLEVAVCLGLATVAEFPYETTPIARLSYDRVCTDFQWLL